MRDQASEKPQAQGGSSAPQAASGGGSVQMRSALAGKPYDEQVQMLAPDVHEAAARGVAGSGGSLPQLDRIQASFGRHDVSGVKAHVGGAARDASESMGARAYASGSSVAFANQPDLHTAAHEAAHVVQQRAGVSLDGGVGRRGDSYERHADAVADRVVQGRSAEDLLDRVGGSGGGGARGGTQMRAVQLLETDFGHINDVNYAEQANGVTIKMEFEPGENVDAKKIGMTQAVKTTVEGTPITIDPSQDQRMVTEGDAAGYRIDRVTNRDNPVYGAASLGTGGSDLSKTAATGSTYGLGWRYDKGAQKQNAWMSDTPTRAAAKNSSMEFETTAVALEGAQKGSYYGSVRWGWQRDSKGVLSKIPFSVVSRGAPSGNFKAAAEAWNASRARGTVVTRADDTKVYKRESGAFVEDYTVPSGVQVSRVASMGAGRDEYQKSSILTGDHAGEEGWIKVTDLRDQGDGAETVDLPVPG